MSHTGGKYYENSGIIYQKIKDLINKDNELIYIHVIITLYCSCKRPVIIISGDKNNGIFSI